MSRISAVTIAFALSLAAPAFGDEARVHIAGPKGCSFFEGLGGDGAAYHALDDQHVLLDFWVMDGVTFFCRFDNEFSLVGAPGKVETQTGNCEDDKGVANNVTFKLSYSDADNAVMEISTFEQPITFLACATP